MRNYHIRLTVLALAVLFFSGCSVRQVAVNQMGNALAGGGTVFSADDDPELIRDATPFSLKLMESVLSETPEHLGLLEALASGFTQYAYAFLQLEADYIEDDDYDAAVAMRERAINLYKRARDYGLRGLEVEHSGFAALLRSDPQAAVSTLSADDVPLAYWTGAGWAAAVALSLDDPQLVGELGIAEALMEACLRLDPDWDFGSIRSFFITYEMSRLNGQGDPVAEATKHFSQAKALSGGKLASVYVTYAEAVAVEQQDKELFASLLNQALSIDVDSRPEWRLLNLIYQKRAEWLLGRLDWLFL